MKAFSPAQSLLLLLLFGLAISGWLYGVHWKRVASGDLFTSDEKLIIRLQDQIATLGKENEELHKRFREEEGSDEGGGPAFPPAEPAPAAPAVSATLPAPGPVLPQPPQKIETH